MNKITMIRCEPCYNNPAIISMYRNNRRLPNITKECGANNKKETKESHLETLYHQKSVEAARRNPILAPLSVESNPIAKMVAKANLEKANEMGAYAITIFNDAKRLTLSANSWPSREVSAKIGKTFNMNDTDQNMADVRKINLQYLNPVYYKEILSCIVAADNDLIKDKLHSCIALSLRCDGSVDRTNLDKIYTIAKTVTKTGDLESLFIGIGVQMERKAEGLHKAIISTIEANGENLYHHCLRKMSSLVTDGAGINKGEHSGLWRRIDDDAKLAGAPQRILKIHCAGHRSDLALKDINKNVREVPDIVKTLSSMASLFHRSGMRKNELESISREHGAKLVRVPRYFEVRWAEYTHALLDSVLTSWHCLVLYFQATKDEDGPNYRKLLTSHTKLRLMAFLADVLYVFKLLQKKLQADDLTLISMQRNLDSFQSSMAEIKAGKLIGGWEERLENAIEVESKTDSNGHVIEVKKMKGIVLLQDRDVRSIRNQNLRSFDFVRNKVITLSVRFVGKRFSEDQDTAHILHPFVKLNRDADIKKVHELIASDLDLCQLNLQFKDLCAMPEMKQFNLRRLVSHLAITDENLSYTIVTTTLARILAATPHSADVKRSISANNLLKTSLRSLLNINTENKYLFIYFNLPPLEIWNPRKAVLNWLTAKDRREHNIVIENSNKRARGQQYFRGIFEDAKNARRFEPGSEDEGFEDEQRDSKRQKTSENTVSCCFKSRS